MTEPGITEDAYKPRRLSLSTKGINGAREETPGLSKIMANKKRKSDMGEASLSAFLEQGYP